MLVKSRKDASNCWTSLLKGEYQCNPLEVDNMEKKLTLERFQNEVSPVQAQEKPRRWLTLC